MVNIRIGKLENWKIGKMENCNIGRLGCNVGRLKGLMVWCTGPFRELKSGEEW
jgi:hypothetical protein